MQIGSQSGARSAGPAEIAPVRQIQELKELPLDSMSAQQLSEMREYLSQVSDGTEKLRELTPNLIPDPDRKEHVKLQQT